MSDGKMSPEELESWLRPLETQMGRPWTADALRAHIAALEKERDDWKRKAGERAGFALVEVKKREAAESERDAALADNAALVIELRGALAAMNEVEDSNAPASVVRVEERLGLILRMPHPGTALLEEHRKALEPLRAVVSALAEEMEAAIRERERPKGGMSVPFHGDFCNAPPSMLNRLRWWARELRGALGGMPAALLVRARNEGLEEAAAAADTHGTVAQGWATVREVARIIRSKKEPESD